MGNVLDLLWVLCFVSCFHYIQCAENVKAKTQCKRGWVNMIENNTCITAKENVKTYPLAIGACRSEGAQLVTIFSSAKQRFLEENIMSRRNSYWIGLSQTFGSYKTFRWTVNGKKKAPTYENWSTGRLMRPSYEQHCVYIPNRDNKWYATTGCSEERRYICEANAFCSDGRFGQDCDQFCHCHGIPCDPNTGKCKYGCQRGWYGPKCDKRKVQASVTFHCFNTTSQGPYMLLRVDPHGVSYAQLNGISSDGVPLLQCGIKTFSLDDSSGVYSKNVHIRDAKDNVCGGKKLSNSEYKWTFSLKETAGVLSENDTTVNIKCDFSKADQLMAKENQVIGGNVEAKVKELQETKEEVKLSVVDAFTNDDIKEVYLGASVKLRLQLQTKDSAVKGLSGYSCEAFTSDRSYTKALTDWNGCPVVGSTVSSMQLENKSAVTNFFSMFTFPGFSEVNFRCRYDYCFTADIRCRYRCLNPVSRRDTRSADSKEAVSKPVYTTVRVLARDQENESVDPPGDGHHGLPLLYLNPITCSMFLFLLTVFLLYYVFFIKSLKRSVEEMKAELHHHNRRGFTDL